MSKRQHNGMGTLYKRGTDGKDYPPAAKVEGTFYVRILCQDGARRRFRLDACTLKDAYAEQSRRFGDGKAKVSGRNGMLVRDAWGAYVRSPRRGDAGLERLKAIRSDWEKFCAFCGENRPLRRVSSEDVRGFVESCAKDGYLPSTQVKMFSIVRQVLRVLVKEGCIESDPSEDVASPRGSRSSRQELSDEEIGLLLANAEGWLRTVVVLGIYTGMRLGDCCTLLWSEVDLSAGVITRVPRKTSHSSGRVIRVGICPSLAKELEALPSREGYVDEEAAAMYNRRCADVSAYVGRLFRRCGMDTCADTGGIRRVPVKGFHSLRHTWISHQLEQGTPTAVVQMAVGHVSPDMTARYTHATPAILRTMAMRGEYSTPSLRQRVEERVTDATDEEIRMLASVLGVLDDA